MSVALQFKLTTTGAAACWNANNTGLSLNLTHIQLGSGNRAPTGTETALVTPQQAVPIAAGFSVSNTQIRMSSIFSGSTSFTIREVGLWAGDPAVGGSKLIGYWSQASGDLAVKSSGVDFIFAHDMIIDGSVPAGSLTIQADAAQSAMLAMIMAHEAKPDAHPQYEKILDGIAPWSASIAYANNAFTKANTGKVYRALSANTNKAPSVAANNSGGTAVWTYCPMTEAEIGGALQSQTYTSFTTTGTAPTFIGAMTPAPVALTAGVRARVKFHAGTAAASTTNVNGFGAKPNKQYDSAGALVDAVIFANQLADIEYDGTNWVVLDPTPYNKADAGLVSYFATTVAPTGYLKANGALVSRTSYAALFAVIGITFGAGDGSTTFALPDLRGEFIRGFDDARGIDTGRTFGSLQTDAFQGHNRDLIRSSGVSDFMHGVITAQAGTGTNVASITGSGDNWITRNYLTHGSYGTPRVAAETRPRNITLLACIKF